MLVIRKSTAPVVEATEKLTGFTAVPPNVEYGWTESSVAETIRRLGGGGGDAVSVISGTTPFVVKAAVIELGTGGFDPRVMDGPTRPVIIADVIDVPEGGVVDKTEDNLASNVLGLAIRFEVGGSE